MIDDHVFYPHIPGGNHAANSLLTSGPMRTTYRGHYGEAFRVADACYSCGASRRVHQRVAEGSIGLLEAFG